MITIYHVLVRIMIYNVLIVIMITIYHVLVRIMIYNDYHDSDEYYL